MDLRQRGRRQRCARTRAPLLLALLGSPTIASKRWAFEQYDSIVRSRTVRRPEQADAAVLQLAETGTAIAVSIDGNGRRVACDPYAGAVEAVLECAAEPRLRRRRAARADQLPQLRQPREAARRLAARPLDPGAGRRLRALGVPVVGGNVSLYNETDRGADLPDAGRRHGRRAARSAERAAGHRRCGAATRSRSSARSRRRSRARSWRSCAASSARGCRAFDARRRARRRSSRCARRCAAGRVRSAHDVSDGGLACALAESAIAGGVGLEVDLDPLIEGSGCRSEEACAVRRGAGRIRARRRDRRDRAPGRGRRRPTRDRRRRAGRHPDRRRRLDDRGRRSAARRRRPGARSAADATPDASAEAGLAALLALRVQEPVLPRIR